MKRVVNGRAYNTETAELIAEGEDELSSSNGGTQVKLKMRL